jgi:hypothetical protein
VETSGGHPQFRLRLRLYRAWTLWKQTPRQPLGASRPGRDLIILLVLPPVLIGWGLGDFFGSEGDGLVDRLFGVLPLAGGLLLSYLVFYYFRRPVETTD